MCAALSTRLIPRADSDSPTPSTNKMLKASALAAARCPLRQANVAAVPMSPMMAPEAPTATVI